MTNHPIVTWTTPWQRANAAWREAAEHMEFHRWIEAQLALREHLKQVRLMVEQVRREEARDDEINQRAAASVERLARERLAELQLMTEPMVEGVVDWG